MSLTSPLMPRPEYGTLGLHYSQRPTEANGGRRGGFRNRPRVIFCDFTAKHSRRNITSPETQRSGAARATAPTKTASKVVFCSRCQIPSFAARDTLCRGGGDFVCRRCGLIVFFYFRPTETALREDEVRGKPRTYFILSRTGRSM